MLDIKKLWEICGKATSEKLTMEYGFEDFPASIINKDGEIVASELTNEDAKYLTAAANALPKALDEIERLRKALKLACSKLAYYVDKVPTLENKDNVPETVAECWELYFLEKVRGKRDDNLRV